jgi:hypothetical protein
MTDYDLINPDANWCPDCGLPRGVCHCEEMRTNNPNEDFDDWGEPFDDEEDEYERALSMCGMGRDGLCGYAGTEHCDWDCPVRDWENDEGDEV